MKKLLWVLLILFLVGDGLFVLPVHVTSDKVELSSYTVFKRDSILLQSASADSSISLQLNLPANYQQLYSALRKGDAGGTPVIVNVNVFHDLDFSAMLFPFVKVASFNSVIPFSSIIKADNAPGIDSTALVGNIVAKGKVSVMGICTPMYARGVVERKLTELLKAQLDSITTIINRRDTTQAIPLTPEPAEPAPASTKRPIKKRKK